MDNYPELPLVRSWHYFIWIFANRTSSSDKTRQQEHTLGLICNMYVLWQTAALLVYISGCKKKLLTPLQSQTQREAISRLRQMMTGNCLPDIFDWKSVFLVYALI